MRIIIDDKIPFIRGVFEEVADVAYIPGGEITSRHVADADALVVRTRTRCDANLLDGSSVRFIATATIGTDHINAAYCASRGIAWSNAPGCNSSSVRQYMASLLLNLFGGELKGKTLGVVGYGHVGSKVASLGALLGMDVLVCDPPLEKAGESDGFVEACGGFAPLERVAKNADILTFHVPLTREGGHATFHLCDAELLGGVKSGAWIVNTARGEVVDAAALKGALASDKIVGAALDVWEGEPSVDSELLDMLAIATPHIAGYSADGKANGTAGSVRAVSRFFNLGLDDWAPDVPPPANPAISIANDGIAPLDVAKTAVNATYDIRRDDAALRANSGDFERLRGDYPLRREPPAFVVELESCDKEAEVLLQGLGFQLELTE